MSLPLPLSLCEAWRGGGVAVGSGRLHCGAVRSRWSAAAVMANAFVCINPLRYLGRGLSNADTPSCDAAALRLSSPTPPSESARGCS